MVARHSKTDSSNLLNDYHLLAFDELDSTNDEARRLANGGGCHGAVIWAKRQTEGKGRMGRNWVSAEGNLFVSVLLQPGKPLAELSQVSFVAAVSVIDALEAMLPDPGQLKCKWPNDIVLNDRKLGGILLESFQSSDGRAWVVVGLGINVDSCPPRTEFPATCLKDAGVELVSAKIILSRFIHHFIGRYNEWNVKGFALVRKRWVQSAWGMGERMCARLPTGNIEGVYQGIDTDGTLLLRLDDGTRRQVHAADVFPVEAVGA